jgi:hypothetical protein
MAIPILDFISNFRKSRPRQVPDRPHLFLAGLNQKVFLNQWGKPETQVGLNQIGRLNKLGTLFLITDPTEDAHLNVWIYNEKDSILLFTKEKLVSHFSCKRFGLKMNVRKSITETSLKGPQ